MYPPSEWIGTEMRSIYVADLETGKISQIGIGRSPSWSPSGEWIAYISYIEGSERHQDSNYYAGRYYAINDFQVSLMSPTGTHARILMGFHSDVDPT
jgi:Tol biopolymer transport system component